MSEVSDKQLQRPMHCTLLLVLSIAPREVRFTLKALRYRRQALPPVGGGGGGCGGPGR